MAHFDGPPSQAIVQERIIRFFSLLAEERDDEAFALVELEPWLWGSAPDEENRPLLVEGLRAQIESCGIEGIPGPGERWQHLLRLDQVSPEDLNFSFGDEHDPLESGDEVLMSPCFDGKPTDVTAKFRVRDAETWRKVAANAAANGREFVSTTVVPDGAWVLVLQDWHVM